MTTRTALEEIELALRDYREAFEIHTAHPTVNSRALVTMARAQLALSVTELPEV